MLRVSTVFVSFLVFLSASGCSYGYDCESKYVGNIHVVNETNDKIGFVIEFVISSDEAGEVGTRTFEINPGQSLETQVFNKKGKGDCDGDYETSQFNFLKVDGENRVVCAQVEGSEKRRYTYLIRNEADGCDELLQAYPSSQAVEESKSPQ